MTTFEVIRARKSIRSFLDKEVEKEKIKKIVEAGNMAAGTPMAGKVHFNVITNKELIKKINEGTKTVMQNSGVEMLMKFASNPNFNPTYGAPVAIVISIDRIEDKNTRDWSIENVGCAGENMLLAATDLDLGSCYVVSPTTAFAIPELKNEAKIPENTIPTAMVILGYTNEKIIHTDYDENPQNIIYVD